VVSVAHVCDEGFRHFCLKAQLSLPHVLVRAGASPDVISWVAFPAFG
jgi:hypothetical protein